MKRPGQGAIWALGAMSGTSMDGVDAALVRTDGETITAFGATGYRAYTEAERAVLRAALGRWPDDAGVAEAAETVELAHAEVLSALLGSETGADVVGFHGQTLAHDPQGRGTHQVGDGALLAEALGVPVVWDFRSTDVRMGGEGAPLAPVFHWACARWMAANGTGDNAPVAFLNLGGVGNLTFVDPCKSRPEDAGALLAFDTGPANAPIDDLMRLRRGLTRDEGGALAATGTPDDRVIADFLRDGYFLRMPPKSLDRAAFPGLASAVAPLSDADAVATLTAAAAAAVARGMEHCPARPSRLLVTGGGRRNATLMAMIADLTGCAVAPVDAVGLDGDMLEAQAFAYLAVRVIRGLPTSFPSTTGVPAAVGGGIVSRPMATAQGPGPGSLTADMPALHAGR